MKKDFITATPDSGTGGGTVTVAASANQTESTRSVNLSVAGGEMTRTVKASQAAGVVTWKYYFFVTPTSLSFVADGESKSVTVESYRKKVINGVETSTQENVEWTATISGTGFSKNTNGTSITAASNQGDSRNGSVSYTQVNSDKKQTVQLSQAANEKIIKFIFFKGSIWDSQRTKLVRVYFDVIYDGKNIGTISSGNYTGGSKVYQNIYIPEVGKDLKLKVTEAYYEKTDGSEGSVPTLGIHSYNGQNLFNASIYKGYIIELGNVSTNLMELLYNLYLSA